MRDPNDLNIISRRNLLHCAGAGAAALTLASLINVPFAEAQNMQNGANNFYRSDQVDLQNLPGSACRPASVSPARAMQSCPTLATSAGRTRRDRRYVQRRT